MLKQEESDEVRGMWRHCTRMCAGRTSRLFWGTIFIVVGFFWMGMKAGWFPAETAHMFWPVILVLFGLWIVGGALFKKKQ